MSRRIVSTFAALALAFGIAIGRWIGPPSSAAAGPIQCTNVAGDANGDRELDVADPIWLLRFLFVGGPAPSPPCAVASEPLSICAIVRHAERDSGGADPPLNAGGLARAETLARALASFPVDKLIASDLQRTQQTIQPLADAKGVALTITPSAVADGSIDRVVELIRALEPGATAVVAHHSFTIPGILRELGFDAGAPSEYDNIWLVFLRRGEVVGYLPLRYPAEDI